MGQLTSSEAHKIFERSTELVASTVDQMHAIQGADDPDKELKAQLAQEGARQALKREIGQHVQD